MKQVPIYDCRDVALALALCDGAVATVKGILAGGTDIPANRLDFAASELAQAVPGLNALVTQLLPTALGRDPTSADVAACMQGFNWIDDDKGTAQVGMTVSDEEGTEITLSAKGKLR